MRSNISQFSQKGGDETNEHSGSCKKNPKSNIRNPKSKYRYPPDHRFITSNDAYKVEAAVQLVAKGVI